MRFGFFFGFIIGAAIASVLGKSRAGELDDTDLLKSAESTASTFVDQIKQQAAEAKLAAEVASLEKQAELLAEYEATVKRAKDDS